MKIINPSLSFGYFGKLPAYPDFIKFNAGKNEILSLDKWLQDGIYYSKQKLKNEWKMFYKNSLPQYFIYPFTGTENFVAGIIFPSSDKSGREFPFIIFSYIEKRLLNQIPIYLFPLFIKDIFKYFNAIYSEMNGRTLNALNEEIQKFNVELNSDALLNQYKNYLSQTTQDIFWERTFDNFNDKKIHQFFVNLFDPDIKNSTCELRLNFTSDEENKVIDLCFFLNLIFKSKANFFPAIFWTIDSENKIILHIFIEKLIPLHYLDINSLSASDRVLDLNQSSNTNLRYYEPKIILENKALTLRELLQANF